MPPPIPHPETALHLYRHLLRESSYLPPLCRTWIDDRIQTRYRDCREASPGRARGYVKQAHGDLRYLRSATAGHAERLLHLCYMATGRVGKRRRILASKGLAREPATSTEDLEANPFLPDPKSSSSSPQAAGTVTSPVGSSSSPRSHDWLNNWSMGALSALAKSQLERQPANSRLEMKKSWDPNRTMKRENCYGLPISGRTVRSRLKKGWARTLSNMLPPLPRGEWERLRDLALGNGSPGDYILPPRRPVARSTEGAEAAVSGSGGEKGNTGNDKTSKDEHASPGPGVTWADIISKPMRRLQYGTSRKMKSLTGNVDNNDTDSSGSSSSSSALDQDPRGPGRPIGLRRAMGKRKFRRMIYQPAFEMSPSMEKDPRGAGRYTIEWGQAPIDLSRPSDREMGFFLSAKDENGGQAPGAEKGRKVR